MSSQQQSATPRIDQLPTDPAALAALSPEERCAIYLNMIRKSMTFFVVLALAAVILAVVGLVKH